MAEGYMFCNKLSVTTGVDFEFQVKKMINKLKENHPEFKFNTCLVSEFSMTDEVRNISGVVIVPYSIPKGHFWFILQENDIDER